MRGALKLRSVNRDMMKKNVGARVQLLPPARRLDEYGFELKPIAYVGESDAWIIEAVSPQGVRISHPSGHVKTLGYDHIQKFTSDGEKGGLRRGFLTLHVQLLIQENEVRLVPNAKPGEPVVPPPPLIVDKVVEITYPVQVGLQKHLEDLGWRIWWSRPEQVATYVDLQGAQLVIERDKGGTLTRFRTYDGGVLLKRRL